MLLRLLRGEEKRRDESAAAEAERVEEEVVVGDVTTVERAETADVRTEGTDCSTGSCAWPREV